MTFGLLNTYSLPISVGSNILTADENLLECTNLTKPYSPPIKGLNMLPGNMGGLYLRFFSLVSLPL